jgi:hypothetical protein
VPRHATLRMREILPCGVVLVGSGAVRAGSRSRFERSPTTGPAPAGARWSTGLNRGTPSALRIFVARDGVDPSTSGFSDRIPVAARSSLARHYGGVSVLRHLSVAFLLQTRLRLEMRHR